MVYRHNSSVLGSAAMTNKMLSRDKSMKPLGHMMDQQNPGSCNIHTQLTINGNSCSLTSCPVHLPTFAAALQTHDCWAIRTTVDPTVAPPSQLETTSSATCAWRLCLSRCTPRCHHTWRSLGCSACTTSSRSKDSRKGGGPPQLSISTHVGCCMFVAIIMVQVMTQGMITGYLPQSLRLHN
jgi:hypothetical protein